MRHGATAWHEQKIFTGWADVNINARGRREMERAARVLLESGHTVDVAYTSKLKRAIRSTWILLQELDQVYRPVFKTWRLNERAYGALTRRMADVLDCVFFLAEPLEEALNRRLDFDFGTSSAESCENRGY